MSTPVKTPAAANVPVIDSPGTWRHPRLNEISMRRSNATFSEKNVQQAVWHISILLGLAAVQMVTKLKSCPTILSASMRSTFSWVLLALQLISLWNIGVCVMPYFRAEDDLSDIPLTAAQRKLLGLPPSSAAPTPDAKFSTPPRYSRTPSIGGSVGSRGSFNSSPLSGRGSPLIQGGSPYSPMGSPILQKSVNGRRPSIGSLNFGASSSASPFNEPLSPSPGGKRTSVSLNNKWLYERGRRSSGSAFLH